MADWKGFYGNHLRWVNRIRASGSVVLNAVLTTDEHRYTRIKDRRMAENLQRTLAVKPAYKIREYQYPSVFIRGSTWPFFWLRLCCAGFIYTTIRHILVFLASFFHYFNDSNVLTFDSWHLTFDLWLPSWLRLCCARFIRGSIIPWLCGSVVLNAVLTTDERRYTRIKDRRMAENLRRTLAVKPAY